MDASRNGHSSNVVDKRLFGVLLRLEIQKALRLQYSVSVACLAPDLPPGAVEATLPDKLAETVASHLRGTDVATTFGTTVGVMLVDADVDALRGILSRVTEAAQLSLRAVTSVDTRVSMSAGAACFPETTGSGQDLLRQAHDLLQRARAGGGDRLYLRV